MLRKKLVALTTAMSLILMSCQPVSASFFSDFCGAIFTMLTFPIAAIAPDNPTLRKNNPFRKKLWQIEAEREEREEQILQRYSKQIPNAPVVAPAPEPVVPQIPIGQITEIVLAEVQKRLPKPQQKSLTPNEVKDIVETEVASRIKSLPKSLTAKDVTAIIEKEVATRISLGSSAGITPEQIKKIIAEEVEKNMPADVATISQVNDLVNVKIKDYDRERNKSTAVAIPWSDYISDIFIKGSALVVGNKIMHTVIFCVSGANPTGTMATMAISASQMYLLQKVMSPQADREIKRFKNVTYTKIVGPKPATWQETMLNVATIGGCIILTTLTFLTTNKIETRWKARAFALAAATGAVTAARVAPDADAEHVEAPAEGEHVEGADRPADPPAAEPELHGPEEAHDA